jgi:hypothetical protein
MLEIAGVHVSRCLYGYCSCIVVGDLLLVVVLPSSYPYCYIYSGAQHE